MIFSNAAAFWLLLVIILVLISGFLGWRAKKEIVRIWLDEKSAKNSQIIKYILAVVAAGIMVFTIAWPKIPFTASADKQGLIVFMVDVSGSMAAQKDIGSPNRLERIKPMLLEVINEFPEATFYPFHFTSIARSITPPLSKEDFPYLERSLERILDINSAPGANSSFGASISRVLAKIRKEEKVKIIVLFSDGEVFPERDELGEDFSLDLILKEAAKAGVKIVTVGVGEKEGASIPLYDQEGEFTGEFAKDNGKVFITRLDEERLKLMASKTQGKYFFEKDYRGVIDFLNQNMESKSLSRQTDYRDMGYLLLIPIAVLWIIFARFYLK